MIFEDDDDRHRYLDDLEKFAAQRDVQIIAWCMMANHVHLLLEGDLSALSSLMQTLNSGYAQYFNKRHDRIGPLFQGRYKSEPIQTDEYLITVIRYIHNNPVKAGIASADAYQWSSYAEYVTAPVRCKTEKALKIIGSKEQFISLHEAEPDPLSAKVMEYKSRRELGSDELIEYALALLGEDVFRHLKELPKEQRNKAIGMLRKSGMSVRQIERITGIGRGVISRAGCDEMT